MKKRVLNLLLCFCMIVFVIPISAGATYITNFEITNSGCPGNTTSYPHSVSVTWQNDQLTTDNTYIYAGDIYAPCYMNEGSGYKFGGIYGNVAETTYLAYIVDYAITTSVPSGYYYYYNNNRRIFSDKTFQWTNIEGSLDHFSRIGTPQKDDKGNYQVVEFGFISTQDTSKHILFRVKVYIAPHNCKNYMPIAKNGKIVDDGIVQPTCKSEGYTKYYCAEANDWVSLRDPNEWVSVGTNLCIDGDKPIYCTYYEKRDYTPKTEDHQYVTSYDRTQHWQQCRICGKKIESHQHSWDLNTGKCQCGCPILSFTLKVKDSTGYASFVYKNGQYKNDSSIYLKLYDGLSFDGSAMLNAGKCLQGFMLTRTSSTDSKMIYVNDSLASTQNMMVNELFIPNLAVETYEITPIYVDSYTVNFDANEGSCSITSAKTNANGKLSSLPAPTAPTGKLFDGWYTAESGGELVDANTVYHAGTTIFAHYKDIPKTDFNIITASNKTLTVNTSKAQTWNIGAEAEDGAVLTYQSDNESVTVDANGTVTVAKGFVGKVRITITSGETEKYLETNKTITITVNKANQTITAGNFKKTYSTKAQAFKIGATCKGGAKLSYKSNNKYVTVSSTGKVTIAKKFMGKATITITAAETNNYKKATKSITVTVNPTKTALSKVTNVKGKKMKVTWKKNAAGTGYQVQYSTSSKFAKPKTVTIKKNSTVSTTISKLTKGKKYYVRIRTYKTVGTKNYYSGWSAAKYVTIKK